MAEKGSFSRVAGNGSDREAFAEVIEQALAIWVDWARESQRLWPHKCVASAGGILFVLHCGGFCHSTWCNGRGWCVRVGRCVHNCNMPCKFGTTVLRHHGQAVQTLSVTPEQACWHFCSWNVGMLIILYKYITGKKYDLKFFYYNNTECRQITL